VQQWLLQRGMSAEAACSLEDDVHGWSSGVWLCELIELLERCSFLVGVARAPRSAAACRHNVHIALEALRRNPKMCDERLYATERILRADPPTVIALLADVRRAYERSRGRCTFGRKAIR
jgi:hypothetical protein